MLSSCSATAGGSPSSGRSSYRSLRDELAERLRLRDLEKTRKLVQSGPEAEALARRQAEADKILQATTAEEEAKNNEALAVFACVVRGDLQGLGRAIALHSSV